MKRLAPLLLIVVLATTVTSCDFAKVNGKCKVGAPFARDNTHVLRCDGGRWKRFITVQQAADFILGQLPGSIAVDGTVANPRVNEPFTVSFKVTTRAGGPSVGETVTITGPATGAGIVAFATAATDKSGIATVNLTANAQVGAFALTAKVGEVTTSVTVTNLAGPPTTILVIKGGPQSSNFLNTVYPFPLVVRVTDKSNFPVVGATVRWQGTGAAFPATPTSVTDADGRATMTLLTGPVAGNGSVSAQVEGTSLIAVMSGFIAFQ